MNNRKFNRVLDILGYTVEFIDRNVLRHWFPKVCHFGWWLLNAAAYPKEDT